MKRFSMAAAAALMSAGVATSAQAQWLKAPVLVFQPGIVTANVISKPTGSTTVSGANIRFTMVIPTASPHFNGVMGTQFFPNGLKGSHDNRPIFYYGGIIPLAPVNSMTQGFFNASIDPLGVYAPSGYSSGNNDFPYAHEFVIELAIIANVGAKMMSNMGFFSNLGLYLLFDQGITHQGDDKFNPTMLYGVTFPIAPWPASK
jgi:hypothetical protein